MFIHLPDEEHDQPAVIVVRIWLYPYLISKYAHPVLTVSSQRLQNIVVRLSKGKHAHPFAFILLQELGHVSRLALYDICVGDSHHLIIVKEISACECHPHKGNSKYTDMFTTAHTHRLI